jgi:superfamily I DNA and/or RNA helicase
VRLASRDRLAELRSILLGESPPTFAAELPFEPLDDTLNAAQHDAVRFGLSAKDLAIVHGPPGTGKTTAIVELIRQAVRRGERVLACAPSNLAVDNLLERLLARGEKVVRLGHPARVLPALREHTLDLMVEDHPDLRQTRKLAKKAFALFRQAGKFTRAKPEPGARQALRQEGRALLNDSRQLEALAIERILNGADVVCATLTGLDSEVLGQRQFDLAVIDEASQSTEPASWLPLLHCRRVVLAGDHCQLPPTVLSQEAAQEGLGISLMERLVGILGTTVTRRLDVQYRMHQAIMEFPSLQFYDGSLAAHDSVRNHRLYDLPGVSAHELTTTAVRFIDTAGAGYDEQVEADGASRLNPKEADLVCRKVRELVDARVPPEAIAVMAPYAAQVRLLRERLKVSGVEIDSVDGFQGREKEAIVISLVRSNPEGEVGFLADIRRMNVAMTRARRLLLIVGDSATLSCHPFYQSLLEYFQSVDAYHSVWEEVAG